jgi:hypothetical protein
VAVVVVVGDHPRHAPEQVPTGIGDRRTQLLSAAAVDRQRTLHRLATGVQQHPHQLITVFGVPRHGGEGEPLRGQQRHRRLGDCGQVGVGVPVGSGVRRLRLRHRRHLGLKGGQRGRQRGNPVVCVGGVCISSHDRGPLLDTAEHVPDPPQRIEGQVDVVEDVLAGNPVQRPQIGFGQVVGAGAQLEGGRQDPVGRHLPVTQCPRGPAIHTSSQPFGQQSSQIGLPGGCRTGLTGRDQRWSSAPQPVAHVDLGDVE